MISFDFGCRSLAPDAPGPFARRCRLLELDPLALSSAAAALLFFVGACDPDGFFFVAVVVSFLLFDGLS